jgi:hypothetical protein
MPRRARAILYNPIVREALRQAWRDSNPGISGGHEEGGFVIQVSARKLRVVRWPRGSQNSILVPQHLDCKIERSNIVASFHTHPNTGTDFLQDPSETDKRAVRDDPDLKGVAYVGEFVVSQETIYLSPRVDGYAKWLTLNLSLLSYRSFPMSATLTMDVLQDELAVSLARVLAAANKRAREAGVNVAHSLITITQNFEHGLRWRINYGPKDYIGQRGGDLMIEVDANDARVTRVLHGQ